MSKFFRRIILCGCSSRSGLDGQTFVVDESLVDDGPKSAVEFLASDQQPEDVATHFDLSSIKFIDDEETTDDDANETLENVELDGFNAGRVREAWVIAVERRAKERLQRLASHWRIQPRDIQAILHQQINEAVASTSGDSAGKNVTGNQITVTLADKEPTTNAFTPKLSNGTIPKGIAKDTKDTREGKDAEKQQACPEETKLLVSGICVRFETNGKHETARLKFFRKRKKEKRRRRSEFELISLTNTNER
ncbi:uncharacterized protein LOC122533182 isoform X1 [Frieseomelitta varia]|uniref:uncharacterized protein LOC122533182 isoform X1 n=1 Tax=Frieseomelitta varia TaxID=561572 RepID=UPI001CB67AB3|nr:uncharacterized protein LOC122533182 isoform X1 [Frieseomelitta varia]